MLANGICVECMNLRMKQRKRDPIANRARVKAWRKANPEKLAAQARRYADKHPETNAKAKAKYRAANIEQIRAADRAGKTHWRKRYPEKEKERRERATARLHAEKEALAGRPRPTVCDLCGTDAIGYICFDHCHQSNSFRGWICDRCNKVLGLVKDSRELLDKMRAYLAPHSA